MLWSRWVGSRLPCMRLRLMQQLVSCTLQLQQGPVFGMHWDAALMSCSTCA